MRKRGQREREKGQSSEKVLYHHRCCGQGELAFTRILEKGMDCLPESSAFSQLPRPQWLSVAAGVLTLHSWEHGRSRLLLHQMRQKAKRCAAHA